MKRDNPAGCELSVQVHLRSRHVSLCFVDDILHIWVLAPPVEGAANAAVIAILAKTLGIAKNCVEVLQGAKARYKRIAVAGISKDEVMKRIPTREVEPE